MEAVKDFYWILCINFHVAFTNVLYILDWPKVYRLGRARDLSKQFYIFFLKNVI